MTFDELKEKIESWVESRKKSGKPFVIATDGRSASGKTTFAEKLAEALGGSVIHADDFFLPPALRTPERYAEPGGNIHYERFAEEVLPFISDPAEFSYRRFDCGKMDYGDLVPVTSPTLRIVEGAYSMHPRFGDYADLKIFMTISEEEQRERIIKRNGPKAAENFFGKWIVFEEKYIKEFDVQSKADIVI